MRIMQGFEQKMQIFDYFLDKDGQSWTIGHLAVYISRYTNEKNYEKTFDYDCHHDIPRPREL